MSADRTAAELLRESREKQRRAERARYVAGLRKLADALEANDTLPLPAGKTAAIYDDLDVYAHDRAEMAAWAALLEDATEEQDRQTYRISGRIEGLHFQVTCPVKVLGRVVVREVETFEVEPFLPVSS